MIKKAIYKCLNYIYRGFNKVFIVLGKRNHLEVVVPMSIFRMI